MVDNTLKDNELPNGDCKREGASVCLRSKRSPVRIGAGVPQTLGLAPADLLPDSGKSENNASKTLASRSPLGSGRYWGDIPRWRVKASRFMRWWEWRVYVKIDGAWRNVSGPLDTWADAMRWIRLRAGAR